MTNTVGVVASSAGGVEHVRSGLVEPLLNRGLAVPVTLTPTAARWLDSFGEVDKLAEVTGWPVRSGSRLPSEDSGHPKVDVYVLAPATANTVAKLALGIADNLALTVLCENLTVMPMVVFPRVNAAHARHPAWAAHLSALRAVGVRLVYDEAVWPLYEPRQAPPDRELPWQTILQVVDELIG